MSMTEIIKKMEQPVGDNKLYEYVDHPSHYNKPGRKECIEEMIDIWGLAKTALWCEMTAYRYDYRKGDKPDNPLEQDEKKAAWYRARSEELRRRNDARTID